MAFFSHISPYAGDPILGLMDKFAQDPNPKKVNLGVGVYYDNDGNLPVLDTVVRAETALAKNPRPRGYLPMDGLKDYQTAVQRLLFGKVYTNIATIATIGGSGALRVAAEFLHTWYPDARCFVSDPTWGNHISIFEGAGIQVGEYPYYNSATMHIKFDEMCAFLHTLNAHDAVLLHPCCHNPTGVDLQENEWQIVLDIIKQKNLIAIMDIAYQGFGKDMTADAYAIRLAHDMGLEFMVCNSFSKNLSLYGERVGGLSVVCQSQADADLVQGQLKFTVRRLYSSPPAHGGFVVDMVMNDDFDAWEQEVYAMRDRIKKMRTMLVQKLSEKLPNHDFNYLAKQNGMFSFTGLSAKQVAYLKDKYAIYLVENGRACMAGLNTHNINYVADAFVDALQHA